MARYWNGAIFCTIFEFRAPLKRRNIEPILVYWRTPALVREAR